MGRRQKDRLVKGILLSVLTTGFLFAGWLESHAEQKPSLGILPFFVERIEDPAKGAVVCALCKGVYQYGEVTPGAEIILTKLLYAKIDALGRFNLFRLEKVQETLSPSVMKQFEEKPLATAVEVGKELNADYLFVGYLFRFQERVGSSIGVEKPASVGFDIHLIRLRDGKMVWEGRFDETQRPLSENLLKMGAFVRRKASWLKAEELSGVGMDEMLKKLPGPKDLEELP